MIQASGINRMHSRLRARQGEPVFEWFGNTLNCVSNTYSRTTELQIGGHEVGVDLVLFVQRTEFFPASDPTEGTSGGDIPASDNRPYPRAGLKLTFAGRIFRIEYVRDPLPMAPDTPVVLACVSVTK